MIKASLARLTRPQQHLGPLGNVKQVIEAKAGLEMFFTSAGLKIKKLNKSVIIPYANFEYIFEAPGQDAEVDEPESNAKRIRGATKLPDTRLEKKDNE